MANILPTPPAKAKEDPEPETPVKKLPKDGADAKFTSFRKVKIFEVEGESKTVPLQLGEYPHVEAIRGHVIVLPEVLIEGCLVGSNVETFRHVQTQLPDETGNLFRRVDFQYVRHPYQDLGPATEAEWKEQIGRK